MLGAWEQNWSGNRRDRRKKFPHVPVSINGEIRWPLYIFSPSMSPAGNTWYDLLRTFCLEIMHVYLSLGLCCPPKLTILLDCVLKKTSLPVEADLVCRLLDSWCFHVKHINPLNPKIKIEILIYRPCTFSIEIVGRSC